MIRKTCSDGIIQVTTGGADYFAGQSVKARASGALAFAAFVTARSEDVAEDLLSVTDARAERTTHTTAKKAYVKMRPSAKTNVVEAIPELAKLIERHLAT